MAFTVYLNPGAPGGASRKYPEAQSVHVTDGHLEVRKERHILAVFRPGTWIYAEEDAAEK